MSVPDESYSSNVPDESYSSNVPDESYSRNVPDEIMQEGPKRDDFNPSEAVNHRLTTGGTKHVKGHKLSEPRKAKELPARMELNLLKDY